MLNNKQVNNKLTGIKIARVSTVAFFVETQLRAQIEELTSTGANVTVISSDLNLSRPIVGVSYKSIKIARRIQIIQDLLSLFRLWLFFRVQRFDIIHSTTPKAGLLCCIAGLLAGVKIRLHTYTGQTWACSKGLSSILAKSADGIISRLNTVCYADSLSQKVFLEKHKVVPVGSLKVIGHGSLAGVDLDRFNANRVLTDSRMNTRKRLGISSDSFMILFVGRCARDKGIYELFMAFSILIRKGIDAVLVIVGPFEGEARAILEAVDPVVRKKISCVGFTDTPELYMAVADLLVNPSYREGFGTVVIEAASIGLATVGSDIYGLRDAIENGQTGILVPPKDIEKLAAALIDLISDPIKLKFLAGNAKNRAEKLFSSRYINNLVIEDYENILAAN